MSPYLLTRLDDHLGNPSWFWPAVATLLFTLIVAGSSVCPLEG